MSIPDRIGPYRIIDLLGAGGMGEVFVAQRDGDDKLCALKRVRGEATEQLKARLRREAHVATFLDHENVARVIGAGEEEGMFCVASELVPGVSLEQLAYAVTLDGASFELDVVQKISNDILDALTAAHEAVGPDGPLGIVHRDVAPKNVIVGFDGTTRLLDFGLVRASIDETRTQTGALMGTPAYIAPEQAVGERVDHRADLYATGLIVFEMLTSRRAVPDAPVAEMLRAAVTTPLPPPSKYRNEIGPEVDQLLAHALDKNPAHRIASARAFRDGLLAVLPEPSHRVKVAALVAKYGNEERKKHDRWVEAMHVDPTENARMQRTKVGPSLVMEETVTASRDELSKRPRRRASRTRTYLAVGLGLAAISAAAAVAVVMLTPDEPTTLPPVPERTVPQVTARAAPAPTPSEREVAPPPRTRRPKTATPRPRAAPPTPSPPPPPPPPPQRPTRSKHWRDYEAIRASYVETRELDIERTTSLVSTLRKRAKGHPVAEEAARKAAGCLRTCTNTDRILARVKEALEKTP